MRLPAELRPASYKYLRKNTKQFYPVNIEGGAFQPRLLSSRGQETPPTKGHINNAWVLTHSKCPIHSLTAINRKKSQVLNIELI